MNLTNISSIGQDKELLAETTLSNTPEALNVQSRYRPYGNIDYRCPSNKLIEDFKNNLLILTPTLGIKITFSLMALSLALFILLFSWTIISLGIKSINSGENLSIWIGMIFVWMSITPLLLVIRTLFQKLEYKSFNNDLWYFYPNSFSIPILLQNITSVEVDSTFEEIQRSHFRSKLRVYYIISLFLNDGKSIPVSYTSNFEDMRYKATTIGSYLSIPVNGLPNSSTSDEIYYHKTSIISIFSTIVSIFFKKRNK